MARLNLPRSMLQELGYCTAIWSEIEQWIILHTSAMAAVETEGYPEEHLRMEFRRLREKWWAFLSKRYPQTMLNKVLNPLNSDLHKASEIRGVFVHGTWLRIGRSRYEVSYYEQKAGANGAKAHLRHFRMEMTVEDVRLFNASLDSIFARLRAVSS